MALNVTNTKPRPKILILEGLSGADVCVMAAGGDPVSISPYQIDQIDQMLTDGEFHGVLLTGGGDVEPELYGAKRSLMVYGTSATRDLVEVCALGEARKRDVPVLGICRGAQIMAVEAGGTMKQHITGHRGGSHAVYTDRHSTIRTAVRRKKIPKVVTLHHQEIDDPGDMNISAWAHDGIVEAVESKDGRCIGVQFHPEMDEFEPYSQGLFRWLVLEAAKRAKMPTPSTSWRLLEWNANRYTGYSKLSKKTNSCVVTRTPTAKATTFWPPPPILPKSASRPAGTPTTPGAKRELSRVSAWAAESITMRPPQYRSNEVYRSFLCHLCGLRFDNFKDREDHVEGEVCLHPALRTNEVVVATPKSRTTAAAIALPKNAADRTLRKIAGV